MKTKTYYVRNDFKKLAVTIVSSVEKVMRPSWFSAFGIGKPTFQYCIKAGWAFRSNKDDFIKKEGREIAEFRMNEQIDYSCEFIVDSLSHRGITKRIIENILRDSKTPWKYRKELEEELYYLDNYTSTTFYHRKQSDNCF